MDSADQAIAEVNIMQFIQTTMQNYYNNLILSFCLVLCNILYGLFLQMNGSMVGDTQLRVTMARRQPSFDSLSDTSKSSWSAIGMYEYIM